MTSNHLANSCVACNMALLNSELPLWMFRSAVALLQIHPASKRNLPRHVNVLTHLWEVICNVIVNRTRLPGRGFRSRNFSGGAMEIHSVTSNTTDLSFEPGNQSCADLWDYGYCTAIGNVSQRASIHLRIFTLFGMIE